MRIVDRETFLAMPEGTVFAKYQPSVFEHLSIKGETIGNDFYYQQIVDAVEAPNSDRWAALLDESQVSGRELEMDFETQGRDGCFDDDQLFAVFSKQDVAQLIDRLKRCL